ncbi:conserved hypothetical protein [Verrucomicrobia bacterium]|nr:conserved hypothetical protein [Verrucomicrobiota bacterium]
MNWLKKYNVVWDSPSCDSSGSMPLGNGDIGANVWMEPNGDLLLLLSKTDAWSEFANLLKLGRLRLSFSPNPFKKSPRFSQALMLERGAIVIEAGALSIRVWIDANRPVIRIETSSSRSFSVRAALEVWRTEPLQEPLAKALPATELFPLALMTECPTFTDSLLAVQRKFRRQLYATPDTIVPDLSNRILWYHRNESSCWAETLKLQSLSDLMKEAKDPLLGLTFGGAIEGEGVVCETRVLLRSSKPLKHCTISVHPLTQTAAAGEWVAALERQIRQTNAVPLIRARQEHESWWRQFWQRSWIWVSGDADAEIVSRGYVLSRFMNACAGRGRFPIKYNGSIFNFEGRWFDEPHDADFRRWGGNYVLQNTRFMYWPMLASGDFEMMLPYFKMFLDALPLARLRTKVYFDHAGAYFPENFYFWGAYLNGSYGYDRTGRHPSLIENVYFRYHFTGMLELLAMMLDYYSLTEDATFARTMLLPLAEEFILFFDKHYSRDKEGKIWIEQGNAIETYHHVSNPLTEIAGLKWVLDGLVNLDDKIVSPTRKQAWRHFLSELPDLPRRRWHGQTVLVPAEKIPGKAENLENPELYAVFPYRLIGVGKPDLKLGRDTYRHRRFAGHKCWQHDDLHAACLGLSEDAKRYVTERFADFNVDARFPTFWGPAHDWVPDMDGAGAGMMTLQTMLLQSDGRRLLVLPAWPKDWDVEFKLHAPYGTVVEGVYRRGKLEDLKTSPPVRAKALEVQRPNL